MAVRGAPAGQGRYLKPLGGGRCTITVSTAFSDAGFYVSVQGIDRLSGCPEMHQIRQPTEILNFLIRRIDQLDGKDPDEEVIFPLVETWAGSMKET